MRSAPIKIFGLTLLIAAIAAQSAIAVSGNPRTLYWTDYNGAVLSAPTDTGVVSTLVPNGSAGINPNGVGIDGATGRIYWASRGNDSIYSVLPDGSDIQTLPVSPASIDQPVGIAIDQSTRRVYWANSGDSTIGWASLATSGLDGLLDVGSAPIGAPQGVVIDAAANKIYWSNTAPVSGETNGWAKLDASGTGGGLGTAGTGLFSTPVAPGLLPDGSTLVVPDYGSSNVGTVATDGSGQAALDTTGAGISSPGGLTVDLFGDLAYVANYGGGNIATVNLDGSGGSVLVPSAGSPWGNPALSFVAELQMTGTTDFGAVGIGSSATQSLTLKSIGNDPVTISNMTLSAPGFSISPGNACAGATLLPGQSCAFSVAFSPSAAGAFAADLIVASSAGTKTYALSGSGEGTPVLSSLKPVKRCATGKNAGKLSFNFALSRATSLSATLDRQKNVRGPKKCPDPQQGSSFGGSVKQTKSSTIAGASGSQTKTLSSAFNTKSLSPGHYRVRLSFTGSDGVAQRRTAWLWVQR